MALASDFWLVWLLALGFFGPRSEEKERNTMQNEMFEFQDAAHQKNDKFEFQNAAKTIQTQRFQLPKRAGMD